MIVYSKKEGKNLEKKNTATFIGHRDCTDLNSEILRTEIINL